MEGVTLDEQIRRFQAPIGSSSGSGYGSGSGSGYGYGYRWFRAGQVSVHFRLVQGELI